MDLKTNSIRVTTIYFVSIYSRNFIRQLKYIILFNPHNNPTKVLTTLPTLYMRP